MPTVVPLFLIDLKDNFNNSNNVLGDYSMWMRGKSDSNVIRDGRQELETVCYKLPALYLALPVGVRIHPLASNAYGS